MKVFPGLLAVEMHEHSDRVLHPVDDAELARAEQRHVAQTEGTRCGRGELGREVVGGSEDNADQLVVVDVVALEHGFHQRLRRAFDLFLGVVGAGGRTPQSQQSHDCGGYPDGAVPSSMFAAAA
jgi:hypothetical protein